MRTARLGSGITLFELLVVVAILGILAGLLLPTISAGRKRAMDADDLHRLRQVAIAASLYAEASGKNPDTVTVLVRAGLIPAEVCSSRSDRTMRGLSNDLIERSSSLRTKDPTLIPSYRNSFPGLREFDVISWVRMRWIDTNSAGGWLTSFGISERNDWYEPFLWHGPYHRLLFDGAVVTRRHHSVPCRMADHIEPCFPTGILFFDPTEEFLNWKATEE